VADSQEGLKLALDEATDIVLLDVSMPPCNGLWLGRPAVTKDFAGAADFAVGRIVRDLKLKKISARTMPAVIFYRRTRARHLVVFPTERIPESTLRAWACVNLQTLLGIESCGSTTVRCNVPGRRTPKSMCGQG
jgi:hypothetical protein